MSELIDLTPSPRVLRMLGEIDFKAWECLCEIIDNSIDSFSEMSTICNKEYKPTVKVKLPGASQNQLSPTDYLIIEDNGKGMDFEALSKSLKAGFSANNPVDKMGLFGMGFNISTARLGHRTEVITSTRESSDFLKVTIDFQELEDIGHFNAPVERIAKKADEKNYHGTKIQITKLRTDHIKPLFQRKNIIKKLGKIYGRIIREKEIRIVFAGTSCKPFKHCVWSKMRHGQNRDESVPAIIDIDHLIDTKKYCSTCWVWLTDFETECPACNDSANVRDRERRIKGWIGIQRYFHSDHYGFDLIRNGRVITELDKSFFYWLNREQEAELEYPVDGHQRLGRIVGELEIDFVKVTHQKDAFEKSTQDWRDVVLAVRGDGPIRPNIAKNLGYPLNTSPLAKLFSAFRNAKAGIKNLVPQRESGGALITDSYIDELVNRFYNGETDFQSDEKWWELLNQTKARVGGSRGADDPTGGNPFAEPEVDQIEQDLLDRVAEPMSSEADELRVEPDQELSKNYTLDLFKNLSIRVVAGRALQGRQENGIQVALKGVELQFIYWPNSSIFSETLLKPADLLINELAYHMHSIAQTEVSKIPLSAVELALREKYFSELHPTVEELGRQVRVFSDDLVDHLKTKIDIISVDLSVIDSTDYSFIKRRMIQNEALSDVEAEEAIGRGEFLSYAPFSVLRSLVSRQPNLVFDGIFFKQNLEALNRNSVATTDLIEELDSLLADMEWFIENRGTPSEGLWKARVKKFIGSAEILSNWRV